MAVEGIDAPALERWFSDEVPGVRPPLTYDKVAGGRSNLTFIVRDSADGAWVLRRPPLGATLGSAHDMGREVKVMSGLGSSEVPVPAIAGLCEDKSVNGAPFYVSEFVEGPVLRRLPDADLFPGQDVRRAIGERVVDTLVDIHAVDPDAVGLGDLGKKTDYVARTLRRWSGQWEKSKTRELPLVEDLHGRLEARIPEQGPASIVHGDYRLDNMILTADGEVAAVLDWELCTLGDPLADLGLLLVYWGEEDDVILPLLEPATMAPGFIGREEVVARYAERSGRDVSGIDYFVALGYWKLAIILEGVYARHTAGQYGKEGAGEGADELAAVVEGLIGAADEAERRL